MMEDKIWWVINQDIFGQVIDERDGKTDSFGSARSTAYYHLDALVNNQITWGFVRALRTQLKEMLR